MVQFFPNPEDMEIIPLLLMMIFYGYILLSASKLMSDGCELLLLLYGPGIIGGLVIPTLGAVPDSIMILMSGIKSGTPEEIQDQITVGVGTLVGSTVMLITLPWAASIYLGRRDLDPATGMALESADGTKKKSSLYTSFSWSHTCISTLSDIPTTAKIMLVATVNYLVVQLPVFAVGADKGRDGVLAAFILSSVGFVVYCLYQYLSNAAEERERAKQEQLRFNDWKHTLRVHQTHGDWIANVFHQFDVDHSGFLALSELSSALESLGLKVSRRDAAEIFKAIDIGTDESGHPRASLAGDGKVDLSEFRAAVKLWVSTGQSIEAVKKAHITANLVSRKTIDQIQVVQSNNELNQKDAMSGDKDKPTDPTPVVLQSTHSNPPSAASGFVSVVTSPLSALRRRLHYGAAPAADLADYSLSTTLVKQSMLNRKSTKRLNASKEKEQKSMESSDPAESGMVDSTGILLKKKSSSKKKVGLLLEENKQEDQEAAAQHQQAQVQETSDQTIAKPETDQDKEKTSDEEKTQKQAEKESSETDKHYGTFPPNSSNQADSKEEKEKDTEKEAAEGDDEDDDDEHWEMTESQLKYKALALLSIGTVLLVIFSDPMVDVLSSLGNTLTISPFYVSFVITPLASNASEVIAGVVFARKKSNASISLTLSALHGAATMNATIALAVFTALVYFRNLRWSFSAEVLAVVLVTIIVAANAMRRTIFMWQGVIVASLYPLSIAFVAILENVFGVD